ncbi:MAG: glycogen/starch synthase [Lachnospiraceae bacterium]|nr:glycogen/starch synthase [Lachnospiraceae bacterium]
MKEEAKAEVKEEAPAKKTRTRKTTAKKAEEKEPAEKKTAAKKTTTRKTTARKTTKKEAAAVQAEETPVVAKVEEVKTEAPAKTKVEEVKAEAPVETKIEEVKTEAPVEAKVEEVKIEAPVEEVKAETVSEETKGGEEMKEEHKEQAPVIDYGPRRSIAFIGSECYPFVKTGGLGDVMYALPRELAKQNCDVKVILPRYECIPQKWQEKMIYRGAFEMDLCADGKKYYVGIMEYVCDGVVYDFIDNQEFFGGPKPYYSLIDDIPKFCYFGKAALAALNYMNWIPDVIHCHDWQAGLVPIYLRTLFEKTPIGHAKTMMTIHNLRFQGIYNIKTIKYWSGLPDYVFNKDCLTQNWLDANMFKGGLAYANMITTVSHTYAGEIQSDEYGEGLQAHLRYHNRKLRGIVNGIDVEQWNTATDATLPVQYDVTNVLEKKKENKRAMQQELGLEVDDHKFVIGLISRLTNQKGLDLFNAIMPQVVDDHTQVVVLGTGDPEYEASFRYYEGRYKGRVCSSIMYDETRAHRIYAGADALLVPSRFEPCGLTQLTAMHYGTVPIVRETGGLKDTVAPYNQFTNEGNGFTFDRYDAGLLLDAINRAKTIYFEQRDRWNDMIIRDMNKDVSWENSARQYRDLYMELTR